MRLITSFYRLGLADGLLVHRFFYLYTRDIFVGVFYNSGTVRYLRFTGVGEELFIPNLLRGVSRLLALVFNWACTIRRVTLHATLHGFFAQVPIVT